MCGRAKTNKHKSRQAIGSIGRAAPSFFRTDRLYDSVCHATPVRIVSHHFTISNQPRIYADVYNRSHVRTGRAFLFPLGFKRELEKHGSLRDINKVHTRALPFPPPPDGAQVCDGAVDMLRVNILEMRRSPNPVDSPDSNSPREKYDSRPRSSSIFLF